MPFQKGHEPANKKKLDEAEVLELYRSGHSTNKIGRMLGCHKSIISKIVKKHAELRFRTLTPEEQAEAVKHYQNGLSGPVIAEQLGVASPAVYHALRLHGVASRSVSDYNREQPLRHNFFDVIDTAEKAYYLGLLTADGCISRRKEIILGLDQRDRDAIERWRQTIKTPFSIRERVCTKQFGYHQFTSHMCSLSFKSRRMTAALGKLGIGPAKTGRTPYPSGIPNHLRRHFWRGLLDGDGWLTWASSEKRRQLILGITGDRPLIEAFRSFCREHTPTRAKITPNGTKVVKFVLTDWFALDLARILYKGKGSDLALPRKRAVYLEALLEFAKKKRQIRNWSRPLRDSDS